MTKTTVDTRRAKRKLDRIKRSANNLRPVFQVVKKPLRADIADHFARTMGPDGAWPGRSTAAYDRLRGQRGNTYRRGRRKGRLNARGVKRFRNQLGRLKGSYRYKTATKRFEMWSRVPWATIHQSGGVAGRGVRIPARPFMWASPRFMRIYERELAAHLERAAKGAR